jgi:hypothetical protein
VEARTFYRSEKCTFCINLYKVDLFVINLLSQWLLPGIVDYRQESS